MKYSECRKAYSALLRSSQQSRAGFRAPVIVIVSLMISRRFRRFAIVRLAAATTVLVSFGVFSEGLLIRSSVSHFS